MIRLLNFLLWGYHNCDKHGHRYKARFDDINDPRLSPEHLKDIISRHQYGIPSVARVRIYVKDICNHCGDVIERIDGLTPLEVLAHQARRVSE